jgi:hypothetical protein
MTQPPNPIRKESCHKDEMYKYYNNNLYDAFFIYATTELKALYSKKLHITYYTERIIFYSTS